MAVACQDKRGGAVAVYEQPRVNGARGWQRSTQPTGRPIFCQGNNLKHQSMISEQQ